MSIQEEYLQARYERLKKAVMHMRRWQHHYFRYRGDNALENAKRWEREVDNILREDVKKDQSKQQEIF